MNPQPAPEANDYQTITVDGPQLSAAVRRVRALGGVLLSYSANGNQYVLNVLMPPAEMLEAPAQPQDQPHDHIK